MHTRTKKKQKKLGHVLLYPLPQEANLVKEVAFVQAVTDCYKAHLAGKLTSDATAVQVEALRRCNEYQSARSGGRSGTNDPRMFKEIFLPTYTRAHAAMIRYRGFRMLPQAFVRWMMLHWPPTYTTTLPSIQRSLKRPIQASPSTWPRSCKSLPGRPPLCYTVGNELSTPVDIHRYRHVNRRRLCQGIERSHF